MFEIGNSLREARLRQGLDLARVEAATKIRGRYLQALEEERFEVVPAETYVKGFLRTYAEYLGLDGQLYVDEFNSRFASDEETLTTSAPTARPRAPSHESHVVVVALAGIVAVTVLVVVAWQFGTSNEPTPRDAQELIGNSRDPTLSEDTTPTTPATTKAKPKNVKLVLTAAAGDCWVLIRRGSPTAELVFDGTVDEGQSMRFQGKRLWIQIGAPGTLTAKLNGRRVRNFPQGAEFVLVTPRGVRDLSSPA